MANKHIRRGKIYFANIPKTSGSVYFGRRPVLIISNDVNNRFAKTITALPCSSRGSSKRPLPTHVYIPCGKGGVGLSKDTIAMCENICNYSVDILEECIGTVDEEVMRKVEKAVQIQIGIQ